MKDKLMTKSAYGRLILVFVLIMGAFMSFAPRLSVYAQATSWDFTLIDGSPTFSAITVSDGYTNFTSTWSSGSGWHSQDSIRRSIAGLIMSPSLTVTSVTIFYTFSYSGDVPENFSRVCSDVGPSYGTCTDGAGMTAPSGSSTISGLSLSAPFSLFLQCAWNPGGSCDMYITRVDVTYSSPTATFTPSPTSTPGFLPCPAITPGTATPNWTPTGTLTDTPTGTITPSPTTTPTTTPNFGTPTPTGAATSTPGSSPIATIIPCAPPITDSLPQCRLLTANAASFIGLTAWQPVDTPHSYIGLGAAPTRGIDLFYGGLGTDIQLNPAHRYTITVQFSSKVTNIGFSVSLGATPPIPFAVAPSQGYFITTPAQTFSPTSTTLGVNRYTLGIHRIAPTPPQDTKPVSIQFICVTDTVNPTPAGSGFNPLCSVCVYHPNGANIIDDIARLINWLVCVFWNFLTCTLVSYLHGVWDTLIGIGRFIFAFLAWAFDIGGRVGPWLIQIVTTGVSWLASGITNVITGITNGLISIVGALSGIFTLIASLFNALFTIVGAFFTMAIDLIAGVVSLIVSLISLVVQIFAPLFVALRTSSGSATIIGPDCTTPGTPGYAMCQGLYMLDNTVLDVNSPLLFMLWVLEGYTAYRVIGWTANIITQVLEEDLPVA